MTDQLPKGWNIDRPTMTQDDPSPASAASGMPAGWKLDRPGAPSAAAPAPAAESGVLRRTLGDTAVDLGRGIVGAGEAVVGLADIPTGGRAGRAMESIGYRPADAKAAIGELYSPERQQAQAAVEEATGFVGTAQAMLANPSTIAGAVAESIPSMLGGGAIARGLGAAKSLASPVLRAAIGEGAVGAGSAAESMRQGSEDGLLSAQQTLAAVGTGVGTGLIGAAGGAVARKLGIGDVDTALAGGATTAIERPGVIRSAVGGAVSEGVLEEMPQSAQEQMWQNFGTDRPLGEGVAEASAAGLLTGAAIGGPFAALSRPTLDTKKTGAIDTDQLNAGLAAAPAPTVPFPTAAPGTMASAANVIAASTAAPAAAEAPAVQSAEPAIAEAADGVPFMITAQMRADLAARGMKPAQVAKMTPQQAWEVLQSAPPPPANMDPATGELLPEVAKPPIAEYVASQVAVNGKPPSVSQLVRAYGITPDEARALRKQAVEPVVPAAALEEDRAELDQAMASPVAAETPAAAPVMEDSGEATYDESPDVLDDDVTPPSGGPFSDRGAADLQARRHDGGKVFEVDGGFVVRKPRAAAPAAPAPAADDNALQTGGLNVRMGGKSYPITDLADAQAKFQEFRDAGGEGASATPSVDVVNDAGEEVAHFSYNGRLWSGPRSEWSAEKEIVVPAKAPAGEAITAAASTAATSDANDLPAPTEAQKEAGNYKKGHVRVAGHEIAIENPRGSKRDPKWKPLAHDYGYIKGSIGADKDHVDVFLTENAEDTSRPVFVVDQSNKDGTFDEHKVVMGAADEAEARKAYLDNYDAKWTGLGAITQMTQDEFKAWVKDPAQTVKPLALTGDLVDSPKQLAEVVAPTQKKAPEIVSVRDVYGDTHRVDKAELDAGARDMLSTFKKNGELKAARGVHRENIAKDEAQIAETSKNLNLITRRGAKSEADEAFKQAGGVVREIKRIGQNPDDFDIKPHRGGYVGVRKAAGKPAKAAPTVAENRAKIDAQFASNREALATMKLRKGDTVSFSYDGDKVYTGEVLSLGDKDQAVVAVGVKSERGVTDYHVGASRLAKVDATPEKAKPAAKKDATPTSKPAANATQRYEREQAQAKKDAKPADTRTADEIRTESMARSQAQIDKAAALKAKPAASGNTIFTDEAAEAARAVLRAKLGQLNTGLDPELMQAGITLAGWHLEKGARSFADYSKAMLADMGDMVRPYLKSWYVAIKLDPRGGFDGMDTLAAVESASDAAPAAAEAKAKPELLTVEALLERTRRYASGMSRVGDLTAGTFSTGGMHGGGVGVDVGQLSANGIEAMAKGIIDRRAAVFVDSGAFGAFRRGLKSGEFTPLDFDAILAKYDSIMEAIEAANEAEESDYPRPLLVMPDVVGDQTESLRLIKRHAAWIRSELSFNTSRPIVVLQEGQLSLAEAYRQVVAEVGDGFIVGIPSNEEAISPEDLTAFLREVKPAAIHILGAASARTLTPRLQSLIDAGVAGDTEVTADASPIRNAVIRAVAKGATRGEAITNALFNPDDAGVKAPDPMAEDSLAGAVPSDHHHLKAGDVITVVLEGEARTVTVRNDWTEIERRNGAGPSVRTGANGDMGVKRIVDGLPASAVRAADMRPFTRSSDERAAPAAKSAQTQPQEATTDDSAATATAHTLDKPVPDRPAPGEPAATPTRGARAPRARAGRGNAVGVREPGGLFEGVDDAGANVGDRGGDPVVPDGTDGAVAGDGKRVSAPDHRAALGSLTREGSWVDTAERNIDLIDLALAIEAENRPATPEEQAKLAKYVGFGASEIRNKLFPVPGSYAKSQEPERLIWPSLVQEPRWKRMAERMDALPRDWQQSVLQSTQYAHYTSESVIRTIWSAVQRMGFAGGKMLEPGMGIGSFPMLMPDALRRAGTYTGIEFDGPTALIARLLSPQQHMLHDDYIKRRLPKDYFDLAIGNPPFSQTKIFGDPDYEKKGFMLHDFFFAKSIDRVRPGGLLVFVTSKGTMDKRSDKARTYLADRADLLGAVRLPQTAFQANAGTSVVTDVIFLRKRAPGQPAAGMSWLGVTPIQTKDGEALVNEYFANNPDMVLGQQRLSGNRDDNDRYISALRPNEYTVVSYDKTPAETEAKFAKAIEALPENAYSAMTADPASIKAAVARVDFDPKVKREGVVYLADDGALMRVQSGVGAELGAAMKLTPKDQAWLKDYVGLRDLVNAARADQHGGGAWEKSLKALNKAYDAFRKKHGPINDYRVQVRKSTDEEGNPTQTESRIYKNRRLYREDYDASIVTQLETINDEGQILKSKFLQDRTIGTPVVRDVRSVGDALAVSLDETGVLNLDDVASRMRITRSEAIEALGSQVYESVQGEWLLADEYLSGDVVTKLAEAELAARDKPSLARNVEALKAVQPEKLGPSAISVKLGAGWVPARYVNEFANEIGAGAVKFDPITESWEVDGAGKRSMRNAAAEYGTADRTPSDLLESALNSKSVTIKRTTHDKKTVTDENATTAANEVLRKIKDKFKSWIWTDAERATTLVEDYNTRFNNIAPRVFNGEHLTLPGVSAKFKPHPHQLRAIWRQIQTGNVYLAHAVGAGKTFEMIAGGMEQKRLGLIKKPVYVVPNHMLEQFSNEFMEFYPLANLMVADDENFSPERRRAFIAAATLNAPDAIIITHSAFERIGIKESSVAPIRDKLIAELEHELDDSGGDRVKRSRLQQQIEAIGQRFDKIINAGGKDATITFEDIGADFIYADEAHVYRKLDFATNQSVKGIDPNGSKRSMDMYVKTRYLESQRPGRAFAFASGTAVTNTMGELYTIMRYFAQDELERSGTATFDGWSRMYGESKAELEANAAGRYEMVERFSRFDNVPELMSRVRMFMDVLTNENLGALVERPDLEGGKPNLVLVEPTEAFKNYTKSVLLPRLARSKLWKPTKDQPFNPDPVVAIITDGRFAALDPRFFGGKLLPGEQSKMTALAARAAAKYHATKGNRYTDRGGKAAPLPGSAQVVFYNLGFGAGAQASRGFNARAAFTNQLTSAGVKRDHIAWFDDANTDAKKEAIFKAMRSGQVRILIGSAKKMGTGVNVQDRLIHLDYLDPPWFPADVEQPHGRILRQKNQNKSVSIDWYAIKGGYDSTMWQMVGRKQRFIDQAFTGDKSLRSMEDMSEASQYEQAAALASGDPRALQLAGYKQDVERFERLQAAHASEQINVRSSLNSATWHADHLTKRVAAYTAAAKLVPGYAALTEGKVGGKVYDKPGEFGQAVKDAFNGIVKATALERQDDTIALGSVNGRPLKVFQQTDHKGAITGQYDLLVEVGPVTLPIVEASAQMGEAVDATGLGRRIVNRLNQVGQDLADAQRKLVDTQTDIKRLNKKAGAPFEYTQELAERYGELKRLEAELKAEGEAEAALEKAKLQPPTEISADGSAPTDSAVEEGLDSVEDHAFFSALTQAVATGKGAPKRGDSIAWKGWLDGAQRRGEFKQEERDWLGVDAWLTGQGNVTREQLAEFVRANEVRVQDVTLGGGQSDPLLLNRYAEDLFDRPFSELTPIEQDEVRNEAGMDDTSYEIGQGSRFDAYQLPGGENYRELLLTMPADVRTHTGEIRFSPPPGMTAEDMDDDAMDDMLGDISAAGMEDLDYGAVRDEGLVEFTGWTDSQLEKLRGIAKTYGGKVEVLSTSGSKEGFSSNHFDTPNVLAHVRYNERTDADGKRVLFLEEVQSDWHQMGRKHGYQGVVAPFDATGWTAEPSGGSIGNGRINWRIASPDGRSWTHVARGDATPAQVIAEAAQRTANQRERESGRIPNAPFKTTWPMLAFKRMVRHAAENGFDRIAFTTGQQQAERYDLSKQISYVFARKVEDRSFDKSGGDYGLTVRDQKNQTIFDQAVKADELEGIVGKELAEKIVAEADTGGKTYSGLDLKVGGDGMKGFYDKILPNEINKWAKRFGAKVALGTVTAGTMKPNMKLRETPRGKWEVIDTVERAILDQFDTKAEAEAFIGAGPAKDGAHSIDVTPAMRAAALSGQPLFNTDGALDMGSDWFAEASAEASVEDGEADAKRLGLRAAVNALLGDTGVRVEYLRGYDGLPERLRKGVEKRNSLDRKGVTSALYDPKTRRVYLFTDVIKSPTKAAWNAAHEIAGHDGLRALLGDKLDSALEIALRNPTVKALADVMTVQRKLRPDQRLLAAEEALAELAAAVRTGNFDQIAERYAVTVPEGMRARVMVAIENFLKRLKALFHDRGLAFSDAQVRELLEAAWQAAQVAPRGPAGGKSLESAGDSFLENLDEADTLADIEAVMQGSKGASKLEAARAKLADLVPSKVKDQLRPVWLGALTTDHLTELGADYFGNIKLYSDYLSEMGADRNQLQQDGEDLAERMREWAIKHSADGQAMFKVAHDATIDGVDPSIEYQPLQFRFSGKMHDVTRTNIKDALKALRQQMRERGGDSKVDMMNEAKALTAMGKAEPRRKAQYPGLVERWKALTPEAQAFYIEMRDKYAERSKMVEDGLVARINDTDAADHHKRKMISVIRQQFETQRLQGVYFPLQRFGQYFVAAERGDTDTFLMFDSLSALERGVKGLRDRGFTIKAQGMKGAGKSSDAPSGTFVADVVTMLKKSGVSEKTQDDIYQIYLQALPEMSMRKHAIHRKAVPGFDPDAVRAFAFNMHHGSHQLARLRYAHKLQDTLTLLQKQQDATRMEGDADTRKIAAGDAVLGELDRRHQWIMNPQDNPATSLISSFGFVYYLGLTPAAALVNLTQTALITFPYLAARHGPVRAMNQLLSGMRDTIATGGHIQNRLTDPDELRAHAELQRRGALDKTQAHNLAGIAEGGLTGYNPAWAKAMKIIGIGFHKTEVMNREASGIAAYRLARADGATHEAAVNRAARAINDTHYNYTNQNRARFMQSGTAKVLLMFRQYSLNTTWHLGRMVWNATKGETPEVKAIARRNLAGVLGMSALFSGTMGLPLMSVTFGVLNAIAASFGDDDEPWDAETEFRAFLADMLGQDGAELLASGAANAITGADIASRVSLSQLWFRDADRELDGRGSYYHLLEQAAGPMGGVLKNVLVGKHMIDEGRVSRGVETMLPKALKDSVKSLRYATEGVNNFRGDALVEDLPLRDVLLQLGGFTPAQVAKQYDTNRSLKNYERHILDRRSRLTDAFAMALRLQDEDARVEVLAKIQAFNVANPEIPITNRGLRQSIGARARYSAQAENGIMLNRKLANRVRAAVGSDED